MTIMTQSVFLSISRAFHVQYWVLKSRKELSSVSVFWRISRPKPCNWQMAPRCISRLQRSKWTRPPRYFPQPKKQIYTRTGYRLSTAQVHYYMRGFGECLQKTVYRYTKMYPVFENTYFMFFFRFQTRSSAIAVIAYRTACSILSYIHCSRNISTSE